MRFLVVSDTHHNSGALLDLVLSLKPSVNKLLFLGDGLRDLDDIESVFPDLGILAVRGNCDFSGTAPADLLFFEQDIGIYMTHGHTFGVRQSTAPLVEHAESLGASVALFGHTHIPYLSFDGSVHLMNPGSLAQPRMGGPTYGIIEITDGKITCHIEKL